MKTNRLLILITLLLLAFAFTQPALLVSAQDEKPEYTLNVQRNFGFSSGSQVRGNFTNSIVGPVETIQSVTYLIDGQEMATVSEAPFSYNYQTGDYALGWHELGARVTTTDGRTVETPLRRFQFVSSEEEFASVQRIIIPLVSFVGGLMIVVMGLQVFLLRDKSKSLPLGAERQYGFRGGTICKRCGRPFSIHLWALNFGPVKFDRCDFCGKWAFVSRVGHAELRLAEQAELANSAPESPAAAASAEDDLRRKLDDTRYIDSDRA